MITIVHISDIHYRLNWEEDIDLVFKEFFNDLKAQLINYNMAKVYLVISGDVVQSGNSIEQYIDFIEKFGGKLDDIGIIKQNRIIVPGNHDLSRDYILNSANELTHKGLMEQLLNLDEKKFNDQIPHIKNVFEKKFQNYIEFDKSFSSKGIYEDIADGNGYKINDSVGIYCINSAILSFGGANSYNDQGRLLISTRKMHKWLSASNCKFNILLMHHPLTWLNESCSNELEKKLFKLFSLVLTGHVHDQKYYNYTKQDGNLIICSAPQLFTNKKDNLGYAIITIDSSNVTKITYRQWNSTNYNFLPGVNFANNETGSIEIAKSSNQINKNNKDILKVLENNLEESLEAFSSQPIIWAEPFVTDSKNISRNIEENNKVNLNDIIVTPRNIIITSPPQFGLTCLAHFLIKEAFRQNNTRWLYLDLDNVKTSTVSKIIDKNLLTNFIEKSELKCIIIDGYATRNKDSIKIINHIIKIYPSIPIIIMKTVDDSIMFDENHDSDISITCKQMRLLALPRHHIRNVVSEYNTKVQIGEDNQILSKIIWELDELNIHRTPLNCFYLLKSLEKYRDDSPVNRTIMLNNILFILFNFDEIPTYKSKPDLTDCIHVLGFFCANMIYKNTFTFTREQFIREINDFCNTKLITLDSYTVFDTMYENHIIIQRESFFSFKAAYWIFYFAAHRMHNDTTFAKYIFTEKRYIDFPEILEFYTGVNKKGNGALEVIISDLIEVTQNVNDKLGIPDNIDPYKMIKWKQTDAAITEMKELISKSVEESNLPDFLKDNYSDRLYDQKKPYNQKVQTMIKELSVPVLIKTIIAASRLLRNSEYEEPDIKKKLLKCIISGWEQIFKVILVIAPVLATNGQAEYDGAGFFLTNHDPLDMEDSKNNQNKIMSILLMIPYNIIDWFSDDLYSNKMGPLLYDRLENENNEIFKLSLILLFIRERPQKWEQKVVHYIKDTAKDSYYMAQLLEVLREEYTYSYANSIDLKNIQNLMKTIMAKTEQDENILPTKRTIAKIPTSILPKRIIKPIS